jgi:hypothetical protein
VKPRQGYRPGQIYHIVIDAVIQDLFDNRITERIHYRFSTGPPIPDNLVRGTIFDRITGDPLRQGRFDLVRLPDRLRYGAVADSAGVFELGGVPPGEYQAIGYEDRNGNRRADELDRADTTTVELGETDTIDLVLRVFEHDTVPPVLARVVPIDSLTIELRFDRFLDPDRPVTTEMVTITGADAESIALDTVLHQWEYRALQARRSRAAREAADTARAPADTAGIGGDPRAAALPPRQGEEPADRLQQEIRALPAREIIVISAAPIPPDTYPVEAREVTGLSGLVGGGVAEYGQPIPEPPPEPEEEAESPPDEGELPPEGGDRPPEDEDDPRARKADPPRDRDDRPGDATARRSRDDPPGVARREGAPR